METLQSYCVIKNRSHVSNILSSSQRENKVQQRRGVSPQLCMAIRDQTRSGSELQL